MELQTIVDGMLAALVGDALRLRQLHQVLRCIHELDA